MTRCKDCNSVITKLDSECYVCGEPVPQAQRTFWRRKEPKPAPPVTPISNLLFMASLALTAVSFLSSQKMSISFSATLSGILLIARVLADRMAIKQQLALRPITVTRLHY